MPREPARSYLCAETGSSRAFLALAGDVVLLEELLYRSCALYDMFLALKVARLEKAELTMRNVLSKCFRPGGNEERIVVTPDRQQRRLRIAEVRLKLRIKFHVRCIVQKQIELNFLVARTSQQRGVQRIRFRRNRSRICYAVCVLPTRCFESQNVFPELLS